MAIPYPNLFEPIKIGTCTIKNRFAMAPMGPAGYGDPEGGITQRGIDYYTERAKGGTGLIITGVMQVDDEVEHHGVAGFPSPNQNPRFFLKSGSELAERVHAYNAKIFLQLGAGFGRVIPPLGDKPPISASPNMDRWVDVVCREISADEVKKIVASMGKAAEMARMCGFDGVQIHAVHEGYLLDQFATAFYNQRTDEYGGSLENRLRFAREIVEIIKKTCGQDFPVTMRYTPKSFIKDWREGPMPGEEFEEKGRDIAEGIEVAKLLVEYGYDALDVDVGTYDSWWWNHPPMYQQKGLYLPYAKIMKENVDVPIICAGRMDNPELASKAVQDGFCDIVSLGRPLLADPDYVNKLRSGRKSSIRPCLSCHEGCLGRMRKHASLNCAVNPRTGREGITRLIPALRAKKVLIIGGGVAGCEAARVLALRGHVPVIYEKADHLGGNLIPGGTPDFKEDDRALARWYEHELAELGVEIHFNHEMQVKDVISARADAVIVATGSKPKMLNLGQDIPVLTAADVLNGKTNPGRETIVVGGGLVGCELALWLVQQGIKVRIVEALPKILAVNAPSSDANTLMLERLIPYKGIEVLTNSKVVQTKPGGVIIEKQGVRAEYSCDSVILAIGYHPENSLYEALYTEIPEIYLLGDARKVSNIMYAIWDAFEVASTI